MTNLGQERGGQAAEPSVIRDPAKSPVCKYVPPTEAERVEDMRNYAYRSGALAQHLRHCRSTFAEVLAHPAAKRDKILRREIKRKIETIDETLALIAKADAS